MALFRSPLGDPAVEAARFLRRLAFMILMIVAPIAEVLSHGLLYILFPVGAAVLIIAGLLVGGEQVSRRMLAACRTWVGVAVASLTIWSALSLAWTLFPADGAAHLIRTLLTASVAWLAIASLSERAKISNIYLLPIGVAVTAIATLLMILLGPQSFRLGPNPDFTLAQRCIMSIVILLWPALGALALRERFIMAASLAIIVAAATLAGFVEVALAALVAAALTYAVAMTQAVRAARVIAIGLALLLLGTPLVLALLHPFLTLSHLPYGGSVVVFSNLVVHDWPRFITGHGLVMAERAGSIGLLPKDAPHNIIFALWYELGVIGVASFVFLLATVLSGAAHLPPHAAPAVLAVIVAGLVIAIFGAETNQLWWVTLNAIAAIALALLVKAHPRSKRPPAPPADKNAEMEDAFDLYETPAH
jgi:hypothetical protein